MGVALLSAALCGAYGACLPATPPTSTGFSGATAGLWRLPSTALSPTAWALWPAVTASPAASLFAAAPPPPWRLLLNYAAFTAVHVLLHTALLAVAYRCAFAQIQGAG